MSSPTVRAGQQRVGRTKSTRALRLSSPLSNAAGLKANCLASGAIFGWLTIPAILLGDCDQAQL